MGKFHGQCREDEVCRLCGQRMCSDCRDWDDLVCPECRYKPRDGGPGRCLGCGAGIERGIYCGSCGPKAREAVARQREAIERGLGL